MAIKGFNRAYNRDVFEGKIAYSALPNTHFTTVNPPGTPSITFGMFLIYSGNQRVIFHNRPPILSHTP